MPPSLVPAREGSETVFRVVSVSLPRTTHPKTHPETERTMDEYELTDVGAIITATPEGQAVTLTNVGQVFILPGGWLRVKLEPDAEGTEGWVVFPREAIITVVGKDLWDASRQLLDDLRSRNQDAFRGIFGMGNS